MVAWLFALTIIKDDYFVYTKDSQSPGDLARQSRFEVMGLGAETSINFVILKLSKTRSRRDTYFAIMLPGKAILNVDVRSCPGLKVAVGLEVSVSGTRVELLFFFLF